MGTSGESKDDQLGLKRSQGASPQSGVVSSSAHQSSAKRKRSLSDAVNSPANKSTETERQQNEDDTTDAGGEDTLTAGKQPDTKDVHSKIGDAHDENDIESDLGFTDDDDDDGEANEGDANDPVTWDWQFLSELYILADAYDTRRFRTAIIKVIQIRALQYTPEVYALPNPEDLGYALQALPNTSPLYKFLIDLMTYLLNPSSTYPAREWASVPADAIVASWLKMKQLDALHRCRDCKDIPFLRNRRDCECVGLRQQCERCQDLRCKSLSHPDIETDEAPYYRDICQYHEHETKEERDLCVMRWKLIRKERGI